MSDSYISVSQLNTYIRNIFEAEIMLQNICVYGEISSYNISNGIAYFNLKDESGLLSCVLFGANNFSIPKIGDMVLVRGSMNYYAKGGKLSFNAVSIMPYGRGLLYQKFLELKTELEARGYFDAERKKPIPTRVKRIGVVSSETGAVIRDIIDVTHRRNNTIDIVLYPVKVQGLGADKEIACGIDFFSNYDNVDVVIVARGGGSMEDLEPFNSEIVANAVYRCNKPLVSAVGHETDFTIIDFVSDLRAPTPSAAAEIVAWDKYLEQENVSAYLHAMEKILNTKANILAKDIDFCVQKLDNSAKGNIIKHDNKLDKLCQLLSFDKVTDKYYNYLEKLSLGLEYYNPKKLAQMGYAKVLQNGKCVDSVKSVDYDKGLTVSLIDGQIDCKISK